jgi:hypothetical protein
VHLSPSHSNFERISDSFFGFSKVECRDIVDMSKSIAEIAAKGSIRQSIDQIPSTIVEETSIDLVQDSTLHNGLIKQTNIAVGKFRQVLEDHEASLAQVKRFCPF